MDLLKRLKDFNEIINLTTPDPSYGRMGDFGDRIEFEDNEMMFRTGRSYAEIWLNQIKLQYLGLQFSLFWTDETDPPDYGFVDIDGTEGYILDNRGGFILAAKLLQHFRRQFHSLSNVQRLIQNNQIRNWYIEPHLQIISSSNKIITFIDNTGITFYVKAKYYYQTGQIFHPDTSWN